MSDAQLANGLVGTWRIEQTTDQGRVFRIDINRSADGTFVASLGLADVRAGWESLSGRWEVVDGTLVDTITDGPESMRGTESAKIASLTETTLELASSGGGVDTFSRVE